MNDQLLTPPHTHESEQAVLGAILQTNDLFDDVAEVIQVDDFYNRGHREIFQTASDLLKSGRPADTVTIGNMPDFDLGYCIQLARNCPSSKNAVAYAKAVKRTAIQRQLIGACNDIVEQAFSKCDSELDLVSDAERRLSEVTERLTIEVRDNSIKAATRESYERIKRLAENDDSLQGLSTGFIDLDNILNGLKDGTMILIAARPGLGKTTLALNMVEHHALSGGYPLIFSIEMPRDQLTDKMIASNGNVPMQAIMRPKSMNDHQWAGVGGAIQRLNQTNIEIIDNGSITTDMIRIECRRYLKKHGKLTLIMIDYVQLIVGKKADNRTTQVDQISRDLKALAKEFSCPVLVLSQLSRDIEKRRDKTPLNSDLRESGQLEQDAQEIIFIHNEENPDKDSPNDGLAKLIINKSRLGKKGTVVVEFNGSTSRFSNTNRQWVESKSKRIAFSEKFGGAA